MLNLKLLILRPPLADCAFWCCQTRLRVDREPGPSALCFTAIPDCHDTHRSSKLVQSISALGPTTKPSSDTCSKRTILLIFRPFYIPLGQLLCAMTVLRGRLLHPCQVLAEAVHCLVRAFYCAELPDHPVTFRSRIEDGAHGDPGLAALLGEGHGHVEQQPIDLIIAVVVDQTLRVHDLEVDNLVGIVGAVRAVHHEAPHAARSNIHLLDGVREAVWSPPLSDVFGLCPCLPHQLTRRIEDARYDDFPVRCHGQCLVHATCSACSHFCSP